MRPALIVLSGGQDSTTCLFWARGQFSDLYTITFDYGQKHQRELDSAREIAAMAGVKQHRTLRVGPILGGTSPLTNHDEHLEQYSSYAQMDATIGDRVEKTFVPMRNALFLTLAANWAICQGVYDIVTGVCQQDNANYPDCRLSFVRAQEHTINEALGLYASRVGGSPHLVQIHVPLINMTKQETVVLAFNLPGCWRALAYSHTAYDGAYPPVGHDHATMLRAQGFLEAGLPDPLILRAFNEGHMPLPDTPNYNFRDLRVSQAAVRAGFEEYAIAGSPG